METALPYIIWTLSIWIKLGMTLERSNIYRKKIQQNRIDLGEVAYFKGTNMRPLRGRNGEYCTIGYKNVTSPRSFQFLPQMAKVQISTCIQWALLALVLPNQAISQTGFWTPTQGPTGGMVYEVAVDKNDDDIFALTANGVFRSTDDGGTWTHAGFFLIAELSYTIYGNGSIAINSSGHIFIGFEKGVYRSMDKGEHWTKVSNLPIFRNRSIVINNEDHIFISYFRSFQNNHSDGVYVSTDNGNSWSYTGLLRANALALGPEGHIYAAARGILRYSGTAWDIVALPNEQLYTFNINSEGHLFVHRSTGLSRSVDGGLNWDSPLPGILNIRSIDVLSNDLLVIGEIDNERIYYSSDNGDSWMYADVATRRVLNFVDNSEQMIFAANGSGILRSVDGGATWAAKNNGLLNSTITCLVMGSSGEIYAGGAGMGLFKSDNMGESWENTGLQSSGEFVLSGAINPAGHIYVAASRIYKSTDGGATWTYLTNSPIAFHMAIDSESRIYVSFYHSLQTYTQLYRSDDGGQSWVHIGSNLPFLPSDLAINSQGIVFLGTNDGVCRSYDQGDHWELPFIMDAWVYRLALGPDDILFAYGYHSSDGHVILRSTDNGDTWTARDFTPEVIYVYDIMVNSAGYLFVATDRGVFRTTDNGDTWKPVQRGMPPMPVNALAIDNSGILYAGTNGGGVYRSTSVTTGTEDIVWEQVTPANLHQNYPNPFNHATTIPFNLTQRGAVKLSVMDETGRVVATLVDEVLAPGDYQIGFDKVDLQPGMYVYQLHVDGVVQTKRAILLR